MKHGTEQELAGWGRHLRAHGRIVKPAQTAEIPSLIATEPLLARGQGRSYGNAALLTDGLVLLTEKLRDVAAFAETTGLLRAEAGLTLAAILREFVPRGWFPTVTPGTKFVSLGGCVAADVHGKNHHHAGTFGAHLEEIELFTANGELVRASPRERPELFWATVGGMGLTGVISTVTLQLRRIASAFVTVQHHRATDLAESLALLNDTTRDDEYSVAWIDCLARGRKLGRSIMMRGHHATPDELPRRWHDAPLQPHRAAWLRAPSVFPAWPLNQWTVAAFNEFYYRWQGRRVEPFVTHYDNYFYPLDAIENWNYLYGRRGFVQYQCVVPPETAHQSLQRLLEELSRSRRPSFLAVLKRFGPEGQGLLSFPRTGYTLALDLPVHDDGLFALLERLDEIVLHAGGRIYLAKDTRLRAATFRAMYPRLAEWQRIKAKFDPQTRFRSDLSAMLRLNQIMNYEL